MTTGKKKEIKYLIPPTNEELNFVALYKALNDSVIRDEYFHKGFRADQLSVFIDMLGKKKIEFKQIDGIEMHFLQIDGWAFIVEDINRKSYNSGWLITKLLKMTNTQKERYKKERLHLTEQYLSTKSSCKKEIQNLNNKITDKDNIIKALYIQVDTLTKKTKISVPQKNNKKKPKKK